MRPDDRKTGCSCTQRHASPPLHPNAVTQSVGPIFTGTPAGVITGYPKDKQVWLKPGDRIRTVISKLGELHFTLT